MKEKRHDIELLRTLSALGIVWFHAEAPFRSLAYGGLVVFVVLSLYFSSSREGSLNIKKFTTRLALPWLVWFAVYGVQNWVSGDPIIKIDRGLILGVITGPSIHLWYIPFIGIAIILNNFSKSIGSKKTHAYSAAIIASTVLILSFAWRPLSLNLPQPLPQYFHAFAAVFIGIFFGNCKALQSTLRWFFFVLIITASAISLNTSGMGQPYLIGLACCSILIIPPLKTLNKADITHLSSLSYGVYYIHPAFIAIANKFTQNNTAIALTSILLSGTSIYITRRVFPKHTHLFS